MFWFLSTKRPPNWKDGMCHFLFIVIFFKVPIRALYYLHMPRFLHLHWRTYAPSPRFQSLGPITILMLRYSLMMKREKLVFRTFLDYFCLWLYCVWIKWNNGFSILFFFLQWQLFESLRMSSLKSPFFYAFYAYGLFLKEIYSCN